MNTEFVKESLKTEIELFKIYSVFVIALVSAIGGILLKDDLNNNDIEITLLIIGSIFLFSVSIIFLRSILKIKKLVKFLNK